jgi:hypothetical protein
VYGFVYQSTGGGKSRWGLAALQFGSVLAAIVMVCVLIQKKTKDLMKSKKEKHMMGDA